MKTFIGALFLSVSLFVSVSGAEETSAGSCQNVDLRQDFNFGPVRNQKHLGWCYAYAITDMFSFYAKKNISAFDVALSLYREHPEYGIDTKDHITDISGGRADWTFASVQKNGLCAERKVSTQGSITSPNYVLIEDLVKAVTTFDRTEPEFSLNIRRTVLQNAWRLHVVFPSSSVEELIVAFQKMVTEPRPFVSLIDSVCGERIPFNDHHISVRRYVNPADTMNDIQKKLIHHQPIVISYPGRVLKDVTYDGDPTHNSSIIGMRKNNSGQCEYLLRNSWGPVLKQRYDKSLQPGFSQGHLWIPENVMKKMVKYFYSFEPN